METRPHKQRKVNEFEENEAEAGIMKVYLNSKTPQPKESRAFVLISAEDWERVRGHSWFIMSTGYAAARVMGKQTLLHRFLINPPPGMLVDHKNGRIWDNTRANLRICSRAENNRNSRKKIYKQDPENPRLVCEFPGVNWYQPRQKWRANVCVNGKLTHLGYFVDPIEAAHVAHEARLKYYGEFAPRVELPPRPTQQEA
jgi:hypothetical protein